MIVLVAALSMILVGLAGLAIDGGEITAQYRASQNAADAAALAAAIQITNGMTETQATSAAQVVARQNQVPASDLSLVFNDASGSPTPDPTQVASVAATVRHGFPTLFLPIMGINTATVAATATASIIQNNACVICVMNPTASGALSATGGAPLRVTGGSVQVNSSSASALVVSGGSSLVVSGGGINVVGGDSGSNVAQISPAPTLGAPAAADPLASVPVPSVSGNQVCCGSTLNPGVYSNLVVTGGASVTMNPGTYVVTNSFSVTGNGSLVGHGVTIYLACASYPTPCASGQAGAGMNISGNTNVNLSPPSYGTYQGLTIFADRNNTGALTVGGNGETRFVGTIYALSAPATLSGNALGDNLNSRIVVDRLTVSGNSQLSVAFTRSSNYQVPNQLTLSV